jgi:hypothetical protein
MQNCGITLIHQNKGKNFENIISDTIFQKISRILQYYVYFTCNSYFLIVVPHIFWVRIFIYKGAFAPPLLKGKGGDAHPAPPPLSGVPGFSF